MSTALLETQHAVYSKLTGDTALMLLITGVFDRTAIKDGLAFPYITIGYQTERPYDTLQTKMYNTTLMLYVWTRDAGGFDQAQSIFSRVNELLHRQPLTFAVKKHVSTYYQFAEQLEDPIDRTICYVAAQYRIISQE